jgi:hypothetical protein
VPKLVVGPLARYADESRASIWVETSEPCAVTVEAGDLRAEERTFTVHGHHYAIVDLTGLTGSTPYSVGLDGERVWPEGGELPPSRVRPLPEARRLLFGSCRTSVPHDVAHVLSHGVDVLRAYGCRLMTAPEEEWPDLLLLLGDQVYADSLSAEMLEFVRARREGEPRDEVADFEDYAELYRVAWTDPEIRWLLSTLSSAMIFDDHDVRDDWNTSAEWRREIERVPWWHHRVVSALGAYYVYQHLGNLSPDERAADPLFTRIRAGEGDMGEILDEFAARADAEPAGTRWSYARDVGGVRLITLDTRSSRMLDPGARRMLDEKEWAWFDQMATGDVDHLIVCSSIPVLLPSGIHHVESWNEALADGAWGARAARWSERLRQAVDLEHWAAFRRSFDDLARTLTDVTGGGRGRPPATVLLLSGDVHYSYVAKIRGHQVYQLVCSPIRNPLSRMLRLANVAASFGLAGLVGGRLARMARLRRPPVRWKVTHGPWFQNSVATLDLDGPAAQVTWHTANASLNSDPPEVTKVAEVRLAPAGRNRG